jgi:hypothetical protein
MSSTLPFACHVAGAVSDTVVDLIVVVPLLSADVSSGPGVVVTEPLVTIIVSAFARIVIVMFRLTPGARFGMLHTAGFVPLQLVVAGLPGVTAVIVASFGAGNVTVVVGEVRSPLFETTALYFTVWPTVT